MSSFRRVVVVVIFCHCQLDGSIWIWNRHTGEVESEMGNEVGYSKTMNELVYSPSGHQLDSFSADMAVRV